MTDFTLVLALVPFISAGLGAYFGGYLKKKGENLATHEDVEKVKTDVRIITTTTKEIEAKISNAVWDRQKQWELKREVLFEASRRLAELDDTLPGLHATVQVDPNPDDPGWHELVAEKREKWQRAVSGFDTAKMLVGMVCSRDTELTFMKFGMLTNEIAVEILKNRDKEIYDKTGKELALRLLAVRTAIRQELGLGEYLKPKDASLRSGNA